MAQSPNPFASSSSSKSVFGARKPAPRGAAFAPQALPPVRTTHLPTSVARSVAQISVPAGPFPGADALPQRTLPIDTPPPVVGRTLPTPVTSFIPDVMLPGVPRVPVSATPMIGKSDNVVAVGRDTPTPLSVVGSTVPLPRSIGPVAALPPPFARTQCGPQTNQPVPVLVAPHSVVGRSRPNWAAAAAQASKPEEVPCGNNLPAMVGPPLFDHRQRDGYVAAMQGNGLGGVFDDRVNMRADSGFTTLVPLGDGSMRSTHGFRPGPDSLAGGSMRSRAGFTLHPALNDIPARTAAAVMPGVSRASLGDLGRAGCNIPTDFWPSSDTVNAWCDCEYAGNDAQLAACKKSAVGWPWTVPGKIARGLPTSVSDLINAGGDIAKAIPGGGSGPGPVTQAQPHLPTTSSGYASSGAAGGPSTTTMLLVGGGAVVAAGAAFLFFRKRRTVMAGLELEYTSWRAKAPKRRRGKKAHRRARR